MPIIFEGCAVCDACGKKLYASTFEAGRQARVTPIKQMAEKQGWLFKHDSHWKLSVYCPQCKGEIS